MNTIPKKYVPMMLWNLFSEKQSKQNKRFGFTLELEGFMYISTLLEDEFYIKKTNEGCLADMVIKPKYEDSNKWLKVQLKTTSNICHGLYTFAMHSQIYENCIIICICLSDKSLWIFDWMTCMYMKKLNIGTTNKSVYNKYKHDVNDVCNCIHMYYAYERKFNLNHCLIPINIYQQRQQIYRRKRESIFPLLNFEYPIEEGLVYDFIVNGFKVQEKVGQLKKNSNTGLYLAGIYKNGKTDSNARHKCYDKGDNDFYWIWLEGTEDFYIFPEEILIKMNYVNRENEAKASLCISSNNWAKKYKYTPDDVQRVYELFRRNK